LSAASGLEKLAEVKPEMFEDVSDQELAKYDKFLEEIDRGESKQAELLATIEVRLSFGILCVYLIYASAVMNNFYKVEGKTRP
jgi:hypothetical protein